MASEPRSFIRELVEKRKAYLESLRANDSEAYIASILTTINKNVVVLGYGMRSTADRQIKEDLKKSEADSQVKPQSKKTQAEKVQEKLLEANHSQLSKTRAIQQQDQLDRGVSRQAHVDDINKATILNENLKLGSIKNQKQLGDVIFQLKRLNKAILGMSKGSKNTDKDKSLVEKAKDAFDDYASKKKKKRPRLGNGERRPRRGVRPGASSHAGEGVPHGPGSERANRSNRPSTRTPVGDPEVGSGSLSETETAARRRGVRPTSPAASPTNVTASPTPISAVDVTSNVLDSVERATPTQRLGGADRPEARRGVRPPTVTPTVVTPNVTPTTQRLGGADRPEVRRGVRPPVSTVIPSSTSVVERPSILGRIGNAARDHVREHAPIVSSLADRIPLDKLEKIAKLGKLAAPLSVALGAVDIGSQLMSNKTVEEKVEGIKDTGLNMGKAFIGAEVGGKAGAMAGGAIGSAFGGVGAIPGAAIGGGLGSIAGAIWGPEAIDALSESISKAFGDSKVEDKIAKATTTSLAPTVKSEGEKTVQAPIFDKSHGQSPKNTLTALDKIKETHSTVIMAPGQSAGQARTAPEQVHVEHVGSHVEREATASAPVGHVGSHVEQAVSSPIQHVGSHVEREALVSDYRNSIVPIMAKPVDDLRETMDGWNEHTYTLTDKIEGYTEALGKGSSAISHGFNEGSKSYIEGLLKAGNSLWSAAKIAVGQVVDGASGSGGMMSGVKDAASSVWQGVKSAGSSISSGAGKAYGQVSEGIKLAGKELGAVSEHFESGGRGVGTVSSGGGDAGGVSYGAHQLSSKSGTMSKFLSSDEGKPYADKLKGLKPGSPEFTAAYKGIAGGDQKDAFNRSQGDFISRTHFEPMAARFQKETGMDIAKAPRGVQEALYSTAVQYGPGSDVALNAMKGKDPSKMSGDDFVSTLQDYKAANVGTNFRSSSASTQASIAKRAQDEKKMLTAANAEEREGKAKSGDPKAVGQVTPIESAVVAASGTVQEKVAAANQSPGESIVGQSQASTTQNHSSPIQVASATQGSIASSPSESVAVGKSMPVAMVAPQIPFESKAVTVTNHPAPAPAPSSSGKGSTQISHAGANVELGEIPLRIDDFGLVLLNIGHA